MARGQARRPGCPAKVNQLPSPRGNPRYWQNPILVDQHIRTVQPRSLRTSIKAGRPGCARKKKGMERLLRLQSTLPLLFDNSYIQRCTSPSYCPHRPRAVVLPRPSVVCAQFAGQMSCSIGPLNALAEVWAKKPPPSTRDIGKTAIALTNSSPSMTGRCSGLTSSGNTG